MGLYILKRMMLIPVTLLMIMLLNFTLVQLTPGGPVEKMIAKLEGNDFDATSRISNIGMADSKKSSTKNQHITTSSSHKYRGGQGLEPEVIKKIEKMFGLDRPAHIRFFMMVKNFLTFNFGNSFYQDRSVLEIIISKMPVSISLGLWTTLLIYLISIPLGIRKALKDGSKFDIWTSAIITVGYSIPSFLFAILLVILFSGGSFLDIFPLRGLTSPQWETFSWFEKIIDYLWHLALPVTAMLVQGFATLTILTKNSFLEEINKQYVITAKAKGVTQTRILYGHIFRNAMILVIAGFPAALINILFTGSMLVEVIFSLDGIGLLGYQAVMNRDYAIIFANLYIFTLLGLCLNIVSDLMYNMVDPRIDFESREV